MKLHVLMIAGVCSALALPCALGAQPASPAPAPTPVPTPTSDLLSYDDPGMHFRPPDGWLRIGVPNTGPMEDGRQVLAVYIQKPAHGGGPRQIIIASGPTNGSLDQDETAHENQLRNAEEGTFVSHKSRVALANGMPAFWLSVTEGSDPLRSLHVYEYVVYDGFRTITASLGSQPFDISEDDAKKAFASLYIVAYPQRRQ